MIEWMLTVVLWGFGQPMQTNVVTLQRFHTEQECRDTGKWIEANGSRLKWRCSPVKPLLRYSGP